MRPTRIPGIAAALLLAALAPSAHAGLGPANVAVVVNADSWASLAVANEYVRLRQIPEVNIVYLTGVPDVDRVDVETFRQRILVPVLQTLRDRGLAGQIDCISYSADLPSSVDVWADTKGMQFPKVITPVASINGLTYLYGYVLAKAAQGYLDLRINRYARVSVGRVADEPVPADQREAYVAAMKLVEAQKWEEAAAALLAVLEKAPGSQEVLYNAACAVARTGQAEAAMKLLTRLADAGFLDSHRLLEDEDLVSLRDRDDLKALLQRIKAEPLEMQPTVGFRSAYGWGPDGKVTPGDAPRYMLSTMLAVTSGRGNSLSEVVSGLRLNAAADGTCPPGTIYYVQRNEIRTRVRQWGFDAAVKRLGELGVKAAIVTADGAPANLKDVQGAMMGVAGFDWGASGSTILPGAICEHLTSLGGAMTDDNQTPLTEFIRYGAAGASGAVTEPFAIQEKFPDPFLQVHYAQGCSLAEAFYQSVRGPYQLLIVGDPLCRPWARAPKVTLEGVKAGDTLRGRFTLKPVVEMPAGMALSRCELYLDGVRQAAARPEDGFTADSRQMPDGYHELRVVAVAADPVETQGEASLAVQVDNAGRRLELALAERPEAQWGTALHFAAKLTGADTLSLFQGRRRLATVPGPEGQLTVETKTLGLGPTRLHAVGIIGDPEHGIRVMSAPLDVTVLPPPPVPALQPPADAKWEKGLLLTPEGAAPAVMAGTGNGNWLKDAKVVPGTTITLTGWFDVPVVGMYQFQALSAKALTVAVDDAPAVSLQPGGWGLVPVVLAPGAHRVTFSGAAPPNHLKLRFGGTGTRHLTDETFRHIAPPAQ